MLLRLYRSPMVGGYGLELCEAFDARSPPQGLPTVSGSHWGCLVNKQNPTDVSPSTRY